MLLILEKISAAPQSQDLCALAELIACLRPPRGASPEAAGNAVRTLTGLLQAYPVHARALRQHLAQLLATRRQVTLYTDLGILSNDGFFHELRRRLAHRVLPPALDERNLQDCLELLLPDPRDHVWLQAIPADHWAALWQSLLPDEADAATALARATVDSELLQAIQVLSYRISASGMQPELMRLYSDVKAFESPFLMQNVELQAWLDSRRHAQQALGAADDTRHLLVLLDQCQEVVDKIRKHALRLGTSISLTYRLLRLEQNLTRLRQLLALAEPQDHATHLEVARTLAVDLAEAHASKTSVRGLMAGNITLLARNITENASRTGEHYIAENRREYGAMYRSAAGAGFIIAFMALIKIQFSGWHAAPLVEAFLYSMNYALGFMLIHILHCTVATKQPAMTASRIAADLHRSADGRQLDLDSLVDVIVKVVRTQCIAVLGNLTVAFPMAWLLVTGYSHLTGQHFVNPAKAAQLLHELDPLGSLALLHAAIAGVCLFLAGLISGYYDNQALYTRMSRRVIRLRWLVALLGMARTERLGLYLESALGGLMGNFFFGLMLGSMGTIGFMLGLPLDIRHITFSAANLAIALDALQWGVGTKVVVLSVVGVLAVGVINLLVSFTLALFVALRSRQVRFRQGGKLLKALGRRLLTRPSSFFWPPA